jgi:hypothetical protein
MGDLPRPDKTPSSSKTDFERAAGQLILSGRLHLAAALIGNATSAMNAENQARTHQGKAPRYAYGSYWAEIESIYDQLDLPHHGGIILPDELFPVSDSG